MEPITYEAMGVDTALVNDRLFIDSRALINHLARYFSVLADTAVETEMMEAAIAAESIRSLALFLLEAHDLTLADFPEIFGAELDRLLPNE